MDARTCPVCGQENAFEQPEMWEICPRCHWEDDRFQRHNPDEWGGANTLSLNQSRQEWAEHLLAQVWNWDIHLLPLSDEDEAALGPRSAILQALTTTMPDLDLLDPEWAVLRRGKLYLEFAVGVEDPIKSMWLNVYGSGDPISILAELCQRLDCRALDAGESRGGRDYTYLDFDAVADATWQGWERWRDQAYHEELLKANAAHKRLIFTTVTEVRSSKPVAEFEDISALNGGASG